MTYIILVAGRGSRLHPLTLNTPKSLYKLDKDTTILQRMVSLIKKADKGAEIVVVTGFLAGQIRSEVKDVIFVHNPFFGITNSIASLWFAREYLLRDSVTVINGDIVMEGALAEKEICARATYPYVLADSSIKQNGDYNIQVSNDRVLVMSKSLESYYGEYAGITKLDKESGRLVHDKIHAMVGNEIYDQWYENALVQMIFDDDFHLYYHDISIYQWTEVDSVEDMLIAKKIHLGSCAKEENMRCDMRR